MNHSNPHSDNPSTSPRQYGNVIPVPSLCVAGTSDLVNFNLCTMYSPSVNFCVSTTIVSPIVINSIAVLGKTDKAWMLRKIISTGRRKTFP